MQTVEEEENLMVEVSKPTSVRRTVVVQRRGRVAALGRKLHEILWLIISFFGIFGLLSFVALTKIFTIPTSTLWDWTNIACVALSITYLLPFFVLEQENKDVKKGQEPSILTFVMATGWISKIFFSYYSTASKSCMPTEVLTDIFSFCSYAESLNCAMVTRQLSDIAIDRMQRQIIAVRHAFDNDETPTDTLMQNIDAAKMTADVIRTSLGPRAMLKMLMDPMGGIVLSNYRNGTFREIIVKHPAAKAMIEIVRTQGEEIGDGTTSMIVLAGEVLLQAKKFLDQNLHPTVIIQAYRLALEDIINLAEKDFSKPVDVKNENRLKTVINSCLGTTMISDHMDLAVKIAIESVRSISVTKKGYREVDIKRYCRIEKIPGGSINECQVIKGVVINKDVVHLEMMRRIEKPRVLFLDCPLAHKIGINQTDLEIMNEEDFGRVLEQEETEIKKQCDDIIRLKPNLIFTEKGISDLALHYLVKAGITTLRRLKKTDSNRLARVTGAKIVDKTTDLCEKNIGTLADLYEMKKIGNEYFMYITSSQSIDVTIVLRGPSKDIVNEIDRTIQDAMNCVRNVFLDPRIVPGAGALEMALSHALVEKSKLIKGVHQLPYKAIARALEVIPRSIIDNCHRSTIRQLAALRDKHALPSELWTWGINGFTGDLADVNILGVWDPLTVRIQVMKTAVETAIMLLRIDGIASGVKKRSDVQSIGPTTD